MRIRLFPVSELAADGILVVTMSMTSVSSSGVIVSTAVVYVGVESSMMVSVVLDGPYVTAWLVDGVFTSCVLSCVWENRVNKIERFSSTSNPYGLLFSRYLSGNELEKSFEGGKKKGKRGPQTTRFTSFGIKVIREQISAKWIRVGCTRTKTLLTVSVFFLSVVIAGVMVLDSVGELVLWMSHVIDMMMTVFVMDCHLLGRALDGSVIVGKTVGMPCQTDFNLHECHYGEDGDELWLKKKRGESRVDYRAKMYLRNGIYLECHAAV